MEDDIVASSLGPATEFAGRDSEFFVTDPIAIAESAGALFEAEIETARELGVRVE
jgi:hypothetical protein